MSLLGQVVALADDALVLGHRLSEWCGKAPFLEEDLALTNTALDLLGRARTLYGYAESLGGRNEDEYAYLRDADEFRNLLIYELPGNDFAVTYARQFLVDVFADLYLTDLAASTDETLAAYAAKCRKESAWHRRHSGEWMMRLGDGTEYSHGRMQSGLQTVWEYHAEMFETLPEERPLVETGVLPDREALQQPWLEAVGEVIRAATLEVPSTTGHATGGRAGTHTEHLGIMLAEMQQLPRAHPGAAW